jgi:cardiolipin synthase
MKRIKLFISKTIILVLTVLLQITVFIVMLMKFSKYYAYFYFLAFIISLISSLWIVNSRMNPGFKIAWLIVIFTLPIFGIIIYLLFGMKKSGKSMHQKMDRIFAEMQNNFILEQDDVLDRLSAEDRHAYRQSYYIRQKSLCPVYDNTACTYYSPGDMVYEVILEELKKAKEYIFLEFFIIDDGLFWRSILEILQQKVKEGVDVRLIYDDVGTLFTLPPHYDRELNAMGIKCRIFNPFIPVMSSILNNRDHRKIMLIDGMTVFTGGINLADEYINAKERFGHWKDSTIMLKGEAVWSFIVMFLSTWNYLNNTYEDAAIYKRSFDLPEKTTPSGYVQPYADTPLDFEGVSENVYLNFISKATEYLYIMTPYLVVDNEMLTALCNAAKCGVDVRIITPRIPDKKLVYMLTRSFYQPLIENGVKIYEYVPGFIHSKVFLADDKYAIVGTVNLDYRSLYLHFECGVWMYKHECIRDIITDFSYTFMVSEQVTGDVHRKRRYFLRLFSAVMRIFAPLF